MPGGENDLGKPGESSPCKARFAISLLGIEMLGFEGDGVIEVPDGTKNSLLL